MLGDVLNKEVKRMTNGEIITQLLREIIPNVEVDLCETEFCEKYIQIAGRSDDYIPNTLPRTKKVVLGLTADVKWWNSEVNCSYNVVDLIKELCGKPKGQWIIDDCEAGKVKRCHCTECGKDPLTFVAATEKLWIYTNQMPNYCPNCGAEMR
jgi:hypothetical protein